MPAVRDGNGKMGFQKTADSRAKKSTNQDKIKKKYRDRLRYLEKKGQKMEAINLAIQKNQTDIEKAQGLIEDKLVEIELKQQSILNSKKNLANEAKKLQAEIKSLQKKT